MRILVTGATGYVGSRLVATLLREGHDVVVASRDGSVFAHLHPSGSVSMAALQKFAGDTAADPHAGHGMPIESAVAVPYAFPIAGPFRIFVQVKRGGQVKTAAFDVEIRQSPPAR